MRTLVIGIVLLSIGCKSTVVNSGVAADATACGSRQYEHVARKLGGHGRLSLGAVADTRGASAATLANLMRFVARFRDQHVDAIAALGDLATSEDELFHVLSILGSAGVPVLAMPGEIESEAAFKGAVARARAGGADVIDLVNARIIDTGSIDIVSAPGALAPDAKCRYTADDLTAFGKAAWGNRRPMVLLSHTPPRSQGLLAVDWELGANVGQPAMMDLINALYPNVALFAHADDAGGRMQRTWLNVGSAARGMAQIIELDHGLPRVETIK